MPQTSQPGTPPSGRQHEIRHGDQVAVVTEVGATLRRYDVAGRPVLDGFDVGVQADGGRGQLLAPWPNRIADGAYDVAGRSQQLAISEVAKHNAIHGLVRWVGWSLDAGSMARAGSMAQSDGAPPDEVTMTTTVWPQPGYPFLVVLLATYRLDDSGLSVELRARNAGTEPAPYGIGHHPYLSASGRQGTAESRNPDTGPGENGPADTVLDDTLLDDTLLDDTVLTVPARTVLLLDDRGNPMDSAPVAGAEVDFSTPRRIGGAVLDTAYGDLVPDDDGRVRVRLDRPDGSGAELSAGPATRWLQVFSGDTLAPDRRRRGLAVEPMSCPPGAFRTGVDLILLAPGEEHVLDWSLRAW